MAAGALLTAGILVLGFHPSGKLKVTCLDVGQGDGILVETPDNHHFLIDGGSSSQSDLGRYCLLPALKSQGISYLDGLFISHTDKDHISGAKELLEYMGNGLTTIRAGYLVLPSWAEKPEAWEELSDAAQKAGIKIVTGKKGDELHCGLVSFSILWPEKNATGKDVNEEAMVMDDDYLTAMEYGMPPISGWGMGIDRVLQVLLGTRNIRDTVMFPLMRPEP